MDSSTENLVDSLAIINQLSYSLRKHIDDDDYKEVITTTTQLLQELRNGALSPKDYYEVWTKVYEQLLFVEQYMTALLAAGVSGEELYEEVQYTPAFIPRLYMMILVASCCIKMKMIPAKKLIYDTLDMCKGIQHPMRGLFLRNFFLREMKDKFPYPGCLYETEDGGDINDSVDCILRNFVEMNRLWIRMQTAKSHNKELREKERRDLRVLVGMNLSVLSNLEGIDSDYYCNRILPAIVNEIISCDDSIAQEYLIDTLLQVFPDDFLLAGLEHTLECFCHVELSVSIKTLFNELIERICGSNDSLSDTVYTRIMEAVRSFIKESIEKNSQLPLYSLLVIENGTIQFALKNHPDCMNDISEFYSLTQQFLLKATVESLEISNEIIELLTQPISHLGLSLLHIPAYMDLLHGLKQKEGIAVGTQLADYCLLHHIAFTDKEEAILFFDTIKSIGLSSEMESYHLLARCMQLIQLPVEEDMIEIMKEIEDTLYQQSTSSYRYLPVIAIINNLIKNCASSSQSTQYSEVLLKMIGDLRQVHTRQAMIAIMNIVLVADSKNDSENVEKFVDEGIHMIDTTEGKNRLACHAILIRTLLQIKNLPQEDVRLYARRIEDSDVMKSLDIFSRNTGFIQCAMLYAIPTESKYLYDEAKAKELISGCMNSIDQNDLNTKDKNQAKAFLLRDLLGIYSYNHTVVTREMIMSLYNQLNSADKLNRITKRLLSTIKPVLAP